MDHIREHRSVLAAAEKRLLIRIARRLPRWINSDHLTLLRIFVDGCGRRRIRDDCRVAVERACGRPGAGANWFGDSLDGTVARVRNHQRPNYGYYVDHVVDLAGTAALVGGMAAQGVMTPTIAIGVLAAYFLVSAGKLPRDAYGGRLQDLVCRCRADGASHPACGWRVVVALIRGRHIAGPASFCCSTSVASCAIVGL